MAGEVGWEIAPGRLVWPFLSGGYMVLMFGDAEDGVVANTREQARLSVEERRQAGEAQSVRREGSMDRDAGQVM